MEFDKAKKALGDMLLKTFHDFGGIGEIHKDGKKYLVVYVDSHEDQPQEKQTTIPSTFEGIEVITRYKKNPHLQCDM